MKVHVRLLLSALLGMVALPAMAQAQDTSPAAGDLVLVAGATGRTGGHVVKELQSEGYRVRALVRDTAKAQEALASDVDLVAGDVRQPATLDKALDGVKYLIIAIGGAHKDPSNSAEFVDYEGVRNLAVAAAKHDVAQLVLVSSSGVTQKDHVLNRMFGNVLIWKGKGEEAVRASGVPYTIIRPGGLTDAPGGQPVRLEQGDRGQGFVPRRDVARVSVAALKAPAARNRTFELFSAPDGPEKDWDTLFGALTPDGT